MHTLKIIIVEVSKGSKNFYFIRYHCTHHVTKFPIELLRDKISFGVSVLLDNQNDT
jgi:hypothetical protein